MKLFNIDRWKLEFTSTLLGAVFFFIVFFSVLNAAACTIGCAAGEIPDPENPYQMKQFTQDGRPLIWKTNNGDLKKEKRAYFVDKTTSNMTYDYLVITYPKKTVNEPKGFVIGLNEMGLSIVYSENKGLRKPVVIPKNSRPKPYNANGFFGFQKFIVGTCSSVIEAKVFIERYMPFFNRASGHYSIIDGNGDALGVELTHNSYRFYDPLSSSRSTQKINRFYRDTRIEHNLIGFFIRGNYLHWKENSLDKTTSSGRYLASSYNLLGMVYDNPAGVNKLSPIQILQGDGATSNNGYEILRYGAGKETSTDDDRPLRTVAGQSANAGLVVHGVKYGEDPAFATLWAILGHPNYGIAVPLWTTVKDIPDVLNRDDMNMYQASQGLANTALKVYNGSSNSNKSKEEEDRRPSSRKNEAYHEFERVIQERIFPFERNIYMTVTEDLMPIWREIGPTDSVIDEMTRFEDQTARDGYNALNWFNTHCTAKNPVPEIINDIPEISITYDFLTYDVVQFNALIVDEAYDIQNVSWNFGDGTAPFSGEIALEYQYEHSGDYLVSCTIIDAGNMSNTAWIHISIP